MCFLFNIFKIDNQVVRLNVTKTLTVSEVYYKAFGSAVVLCVLLWLEILGGSGD